MEIRQQPAAAGITFPSVVRPEIGKFIRTDLSITNIPRSADVDPGLASKACDIALKEFGMGSVLAIEKMGLTTVQSNCLLLSCANGQIVLRQCLRQQNQQYINSVGESLNYLKSRKDLQVPESLKFKSGSYSIQDDQGHCWTASSFSDAKNYFEGTALQMHSTGRALGKFHVGLETMPDAITDNFTSKNGAYQAQSMTAGDLQSIEENLRILGNRDLLQIFMREKDIINEALKIRDRIACDIRIPNGHMTFLHYDLHPHNILAMQDSSVVLVDFDNIRIGFAEVDLGFALHRLGRQTAELQGKEQVRNACHQFIDGYCSEHPGFEFNPCTALRHALDRSLIGVVGVLGRMSRQDPAEPVNLEKFEKFAVTAREILWIFSANGWIYPGNQNPLSCHRLPALIN